MILLMGATCTFNAPAALASESSTLTYLHSTQQTGQVKGIVEDAFGPATGASVIVKGTTNGTITDMDGGFVLNGVKKGDIIQVSFIGYITKEITYTGQNSLKFTIEEDTQKLDEVVVVGYGTQKKVNVTGAVGLVNAETLEARPVNNVSQALQGVVPGLNFSVNDNGGMLNNSLNVNIRGAGTIGDGSNSSPLVLIDGIEGNMNSLAPQDIESISVLKDAASAAIYGARASFGVILITTKSGKAGKTKVNYSNSFRYSSAVAVPEMMDSYQFAQFYNKAAKNAGMGAVFSDEVMERIVKFQNNSWSDEEREMGLDSGTLPKPNGTQWEQYVGSHANTDWFSEQYQSWAPSMEHNISVSGGNEKVTYSVSGSLLDVEGLLRHGGDNLNRYNLSGKINAKLNDYVTLNYNSKWIRQIYDRPSYLTGLFFHNIARRWPTCAVTDPNGYYTEGSEINQLRDGGRDKEERDWTYNQVQLVIEPIKNWKIYAEGNLRTETWFNQWEVLPVYYHDTEGNPVGMNWNGDYAPGFSRVSSNGNKQNYITTNVYTDYFKDFKNGHYLKGMVGFNSELMKTRGVSGTIDGLTTPNVPTLNTGTTNMKASGGYAHWASAGFFGRLNYNYQEKYLLEVNGRYDGVSRFVGDKRWGFFPSFSAGWNISREAFYNEYLGAFAEKVNTLKVRGSWGELGNMNTDAWYPFFQSMSIGNANNSWLLDGKKPNSASAPGLVSSLMTWETVRQWNVGADFGAFNNRFTGSFDYFKRTTLDMIGPAPELPSILGTSVPKINNCDMESFGWELELNWRDQVADFNYGVKVVVSDDQQRITRYPNDNWNIDQYYKGRMLGDIWGYTTVGIAQDQEQMDNHLINNRPSWGNNWQAGDIMYADLNGDGVVNQGNAKLGDSGDYTIIGNNTPRYKFGITLDAAWKGFDFSVFFQGVAKRDYWLNGAYFWGIEGGQWQSTGFTNHWDFWRPEGDELGANTDAYYPRIDFSTNKNQYRQSGYLQNAAYIRMKNIQLGYTFPRSWMNKVKVDNLRVYVSGDNLLTISDITGIFDPETLGGSWGAGKLYPLQKTLSFGLSLSF